MKKFLTSTFLIIFLNSSVINADEGSWKKWFVNAFGFTASGAVAAGGMTVFSNAQTYEQLAGGTAVSIIGTVGAGLFGKRLLDDSDRSLIADGFLGVGVGAFCWLRALDEKMQEIQQNPGTFSKTTIQLVALPNKTNEFANPWMLSLGTVMCAAGYYAVKSGMRELRESKKNLQNSQTSSTENLTIDAKSQLSANNSSSQFFTGSTELSNVKKDLENMDVRLKKIETWSTAFTEWSSRLKPVSQADLLTKKYEGKGLNILYLEQKK